MCIQMLRVVLTCAVAVGAGSVYADAACVVDAFDVGAYYAVHADAAWVVDVCLRCFSTRIAAHLCIHLIL